MVVVCFNEENVHTFKDVIAYDVLTMDDVKGILKVQQENFINGQKI